MFVVKITVHSTLPLRSEDWTPTSSTVTPVLALFDFLHQNVLVVQTSLLFSEGDYSIVTMHTYTFFTMAAFGLQTQM